MPRRKRTGAGSGRGGQGGQGGRRVDRSLVLLGDARPSSSPVWENGRLVTPMIALWMRADNGLLWSVHLGAADAPAAALVEALVNPAMPALPGLPRATGLPREVVLFDEALARQVMDRLPDPRIDVSIAPRHEQFEEAFGALLEALAPAGDGTLDLPDETVRALCAACARLWHTKPWQVADDHPLIALRPQPAGSGGARRFYASVLGAARQVYGVGLYTSLTDYARDSAHGALRQLAEDVLESPGLADLSEADRERLEAQIDAQLGIDPAAYMRRGGRVLLVSFDPRDRMRPEYGAQLTRNGWPADLDVVPTFIGRGGRNDAPTFSAREATAAAIAVEALLTFVERHEEAITDEDFPIRDSVVLSRPSGTITVACAMPP